MCFRLRLWYDSVNGCRKYIFRKCPILTHLQSLSPGQLTSPSLISLQSVSVLSIYSIVNKRMIDCLATLQSQPRSHWQKTVKRSQKEGWVCNYQSDDQLIEIFPWGFLHANTYFNISDVKMSLTDLVDYINCHHLKYLSSVAWQWPLFIIQSIKML